MFSIRTLECLAINMWNNVLIKSQENGSTCEERCIAYGSEINNKSSEKWVCLGQDMISWNNSRIEEQWNWNAGKETCIASELQVYGSMCEGCRG
jgi:hypothetical protein